ncbi:unnamed protein product [Coregonus sp. 'balchen']|nr:unnamed protein product [Coregonus sp. 'balchen']
MELRLEAIIGRFGELDEAERVLTGSLERHRQALAKQKQQEQVWTSLLEDRLHICLSARVGVPDLAPSLPTTASVLRKRPKDSRVDKAMGLL